MKLKMYIVAYKRAAELIGNLESIFKNDWVGHDLKINIINNHTQFDLPPHLAARVNVMHNVCRPDFSTGHLSRNWNQAIINGFKDLNSPDCDIVITCQDDSVFESNWIHRLIDLHQKYSFIQMGVGDNFCSYLPEAVKNIGLWDERFCGIGYQEADYFLRAVIYNRDKSSINDHAHGRVFNNIEPSLCQRPGPITFFTDDHNLSRNFGHPISKKVFEAKWIGITPEIWTPHVLNNLPTKSAITNFVTYPYFEKNIIDLPGKNYLI